MAFTQPRSQRLPDAPARRSTRDCGKRREAKLYLEDPSKFHILGAAIPAPGRLHNYAISTESLLAELKQRILAAVSGRCLNRFQIRSMYGGSQEVASDAALNQATLAHVVSCQKCLDAIASRLRLNPLSNRDPNDTTRYDSGGKSQRRQGSPSRHTNGLLLRWKRAAEGVLQHQPKQLWVTVNGQPMGSHTIAADQNDFSFTVPLKEEIEFIEVLSEQQVRLLLLPVPLRPPEGEATQSAAVNLSDGRQLSASLSFDSPWPTIHLSYSVPAVRMHEPSAETPEPQPSLFQSMLPRPRFWSPRILTAALALVVILAVLFVQNRENTASAAVVVQRVFEWEHERTNRPGAVLHRSFDFIERKRSDGSLVRRRVEIWRRTGAKISRLLDASGKVLETSHLAAPQGPLSAGNAWQFDPSADAYNKLSHDVSSSTVSADSHTIRLESKAGTVQVDFWVDKSSYRPVRETIHTPESDFEFEEAITETVPASSTPFAEAGRPLAELSSPHTFPPAEPPAIRSAVVSEGDLDEAEAALWVGLHAKAADLGEEIHIRRQAQEIELAGVVDSEARKQDLIAALETIPHVRISLLSPEDIAVSAAVTDNLRSALSTTSDGFTSVRPPLLAAWLEENYPEAAGRRAWTARVLDLARECLRRAYALRALSERYSGTNRRDIAAIARDHTQALRDNWTAVAEVWRPVLALSPSLGLSTPGDASALFGRMQSLRAHMLNLLAGDASAPQVSDLASELRGCQGDWRIIEATLASLPNRTESTEKK